MARDQITSKNCQALESRIGSQRSDTLVESPSYNEEHVDQARVLMLAQIGVAVVKVDGATIHLALALLLKRNHSKGITKLS